MRVVSLGTDARAVDLRALSARPPDVARDVAAIVERVRTGGDGALKELTRRLDRVEPGDLSVALDVPLPAELEGALDLARTNVELVARAGLRDAQEVHLPQGQRVELLELPLRRAGAYVPGGRAAYVSTVVMCAAVARVAGVEQVVVCTPPPIAPVLVAACARCGVDELYAVGGAQAIAALAYGTETIAPVDVVVGPGNAYVTEAKRQVAGDVAIDGLAGPSELVVVAAPGADPELVALDLLAQAEHGAGSLCAAISPDAALLDAIVAEAEGHGEETGDVPLAAVAAPDVEAALALAEQVAPEHLELVGVEAEALAARVRSAGCLFVGQNAATAFGDYVAGSNHVLPTGGAARFASGLSVATFRRRMTRVSLPPGAAARLAPAGSALARAEGFPVHAESMERRA